MPYKDHRGLTSRPSSTTLAPQPQLMLAPKFPPGPPHGSSPQCPPPRPAAQPREPQPPRTAGTSRSTARPGGSPAAGVRGGGGAAPVTRRAAPAGPGPHRSAPPFPKPTPRAGGGDGQAPPPARSHHFPAEPPRRGAPRSPSMSAAPPTVPTVPTALLGQGAPSPRRTPSPSREGQRPAPGDPCIAPPAPGGEGGQRCPEPPPQARRALTGRSGAGEMEATGARRGSAFLRWWRRCRCRPWMAGAGSAPGQGCGTTPAGCARRGEEEEEEEEREGLGPQGIAGGRWGALRRAAAEGTPGVWPAPRPVAAARALQRCLLGSPPLFFLEFRLFCASYQFHPLRLLPSLAAVRASRLTPPGDALIS